VEAKMQDDNRLAAMAVYIGKRPVMSHVETRHRTAIRPVKIAILIALVFGALLRGGAAEGAKPLGTWDDVVTTFGAIRSEHRISRREADVLAILYFRRYYGFCGIGYPVIRKGDCWVADTLVGYAGANGGQIKINAKSGVISSPQGKTVAPPWAELREFIRWLDEMEKSAAAPGLK